MQLSQAFISKLPPGTNPDDVRFFKCAAQIVELEQDELTDPDMVIANQEVGGPPLMNSEGKPTIMKVVAWMAHEGVNRNRQAFVRDELQDVAPTLFREPNFGVMDYNHSAVAYFSDDPTVVGLWYRVEYRYDDKAKKYGLLASGILWSWLFPNEADTLLADQVRNGFINFSMAAIPGHIELAEDESGAYEILHEPIFFTVSALDVKPADADATGIGSEAVEDSEEIIRNKLVAMASAHPWQTAKANDNNSIEGVTMKTFEEALQMVEELYNRVGEGITPGQEAITEFANTIKEFAGLNAELEAHLEEANKSVESLTTQLSEVSTARDAAVAHAEQIAETNTALEAELTDLRAFKAEIDAAKEIEKAAEALAARKSKLPALYLEIHNKKEDEIRGKIEARWSAMSDEEFDLYVEELTGFDQSEVRVSYLDRSRREGVLPNFSGSTENSDKVKGSIAKLNAMFGL